MLIRILTVLLVCLLLPQLAAAESVYVNDQLRVGVRTEPSNSVTPVGVVTTGMKLDVLDRRNGFIRIRTQDGLEGWINDSYVTSEKPSALIAEELQEKYRKLAEEAALKDKQIKSAENVAAKLSKENNALQDANAGLRVQLLEAQAQQDDSVFTPYLLLVILGLVLGVGGFVAGMLWQRRQAMRRLGGLRV